MRSSPVTTSRTIPGICAVCAVACFLWIARPSLAAGLAGDDPMNLYNYWHLGLARVALQNLLFFTTAYRPLGGLFYLPIYRLAHLDPLLYHVIIDVILGIDTWLLYRLARLLGVPRPAAGLAAILSCAHPAMISLFLFPSDLYDALCFLFYFGALVYYTGIRSRGRELRPGQKVLFLVMYIAALNAKEIGVTLPVFLALYELLYHPEGAKRLRTWFTGAGNVAAIGGLIAVIYTAGKFLGSDSLASNIAYRPEFTLHRFLANNAHYLDDLTYREQPWFTSPGLLGAWAIAGLWAWWRNERFLKFCWIFVIVSPLPIAFIPQRGLYNLYLLLAGWSLIVCSAVWDVICLVTSERRLPASAALAARIALSAILIVLWTRDRMWRAGFAIDATRHMQAPTRDAIEQLRALNIAMPHGSRCVFLHDPFEQWDMFFIANLWYNDPSIEFFLQRYHKLPDAELARMDYVFDWKDGRIVLVSSRRGTDNSLTSAQRP